MPVGIPFVALKRAGCWGNCSNMVRCSTAEAVQSAALTFQSIHNIHSCDSLALGVLSVSDGIPDDILEEHLEHTSGFFVNQTRDTLDTTTTSETANSGLCDTLDVITQNFAVTLGASLSKTLSSFSSARHDDYSVRDTLVLALLPRASTFYTERRETEKIWWKSVMAENPANGRSPLAEFHETESGGWLDFPP